MVLDFSNSTSTRGDSLLEIRSPNAASSLALSHRPRSQRAYCLRFGIDLLAVDHLDDPFSHGLEGFLNLDSTLRGCLEVLEPIGISYLLRLLS
jgi:hypothetical protein